MKYSGIDLEIEKNGKGLYYSKNKIYVYLKCKIFKGLPFLKSMLDRSECGS